MSTLGVSPCGEQLATRHLRRPPRSVAGNGPTGPQPHQWDRQPISALHAGLHPRQPFFSLQLTEHGTLLSACLGPWATNPAYGHTAARSSPSAALLGQGRIAAIAAWDAPASSRLCAPASVLLLTCRDVIPRDRDCACHQHPRLLTVESMVPRSEWRRFGKVKFGCRGLLYNCSLMVRSGVFVSVPSVYPYGPVVLPISKSRCFSSPSSRHSACRLCHVSSMNSPRRPASYTLARRQTHTSWRTRPTSASSPTRASLGS